MRERLQKILAAAGLGSRRAAEEWIRDGRVRVDGRVAELGERADPETQRITVDGRPLSPEAPAYWMLHKPRGVVTTSRDPHARRTVLDLLPAGGPRLFPVGRLDRDTEGLVLLTNDGALAHVLLHPSLESEREYRVTVRGAVAPRTFARLGRGIELDGVPTAPARVARVRRRAGDDTTTFHLVLREGRKRQIRRTLEALGHPVVRLVRVRMGPLRLGRLAPGEARPLTPAEVEALRAHARRQRARAQAGGTSPPRGRKPRRNPRRRARADSRRYRTTH